MKRPTKQPRAKLLLFAVVRRIYVMTRQGLGYRF
jgi:hypothetical protein